MAKVHHRSPVAPQTICSLALIWSGRYPLPHTDDPKKVTCGNCKRRWLTDDWAEERKRGRTVRQRVANP